CEVLPLMKFLTPHCISPFSEGPEYEDFSEGWGNVTLSDNFARMDSVWKYQRFQVTGTYGYLGELATYPGGGYVATMGRTWRNSLININYLFQNDWIDRYTRGLFIEFLMYSPNGNLFHTVRVAFELATTGLVLTVFNVYTAHLLFMVSESSAGFQVALTLFVIMICILLVCLVFKLMNKNKFILRDLWILVDIVIVALSLACLSLFVEREFTVRAFLDQIENAKHNRFIDYFHLLISQATMTILAALLVFLATLRLWKLLRFMSIIRISDKTLKLAIPPLFIVFIYHMLFFFFGLTIIVSSGMVRIQV
ncbi:Polycystic kidney disease protein 1-like 3, partial [Gonioctena quinquepunctata]